MAPGGAEQGRASRGGLLAVHAHPDDETLSTGALLAAWAAAGRPVTVVTCTRGEQGEVIPPSLRHLEGDGPALADLRERELAAALASLGVTDHVFLDRVDPAGRRFTDSGMAWAAVGQAAAPDTLPDGAFVRVDVQDAAGLLAQVIRDRRPQVVVGYEPRGGYGHPDHVHAHHVMTRAVDLVGVPSPVVLWAALDESALRDGYRAVSGVAADDGLAAPDADGPVPSAAVPSAGLDVEVDVAAVLPQVLGALHAHATQVQAVREIPPTPDGRSPVASLALSNGVVQPVAAREVYRCAPGYDGSAVDWPAGVTWVREGRR